MKKTSNEMLEGTLDMMIPQTLLVGARAIGLVTGASPVKDEGR